MGALQEYILELKVKLNKMKSSGNNISDLEILRYIYIDLGKKMNFDVQYTFGNSKQKRNIYDRLVDEKELNKAFENRTIICKSLAYIVDLILAEFEICAYVEYDRDDYGKIKNGSHVYNVVELSDGHKFIIDLEEDLEYIQTGAKTKHFGLSFVNHKDFIYDEEKMRQIDKKIGYIPEGIYMDDIIWMIEKAVSTDISDEVLFEFILNNLNKYQDISNIGYRERILYYERMIEHFFDNKSSNNFCRKSIKKIEKFDCYRVVDGKRQYISCIITNFKKEKIYIFNYDKNCYESVSIDQFSEMVENGLEVPNEGRAKRLKRFRSKVCCMGQDL